MVGEMPAEEANTRFRRLFKLQIHTRRESWVCLVVRGGGVYPNSCHFSLEISPEGLGIQVHGRESRTRLVQLPTLRTSQTLAAPSCHHTHSSPVARVQSPLSASSQASRSCPCSPSSVFITSDRNSACLVSRAHQFTQTTRNIVANPYSCSQRSRVLGCRRCPRAAGKGKGKGKAASERGAHRR
jgi:hypothetical protein